MPKTTKEKNQEFLKTMYKEAGINYRYFLSWRHKLMVRFFLFMAAVFVVFKWYYEGGMTNDLAWLVSLLSFIIVLAFWAMDHRSKTLFRASQRVGEEIEAELVSKKNVGLYKAINFTTDNNKIIASRTMGIIYALTAFCLLALTIYFLFV